MIVAGGGTLVNSLNPRLTRSTAALNFSHLLLSEQGQVRWNSIKAYI